MTAASSFDPLTPETLPARLGQRSELRRRIGDNIAQWDVREVGDGNLNLVFIVRGDASTVVVKQALPYVRLVGEGWPLPLKRSYFEYQALIRQNEPDPGRVPLCFISTRIGR
jgi:5-methylthioribose kinase